MKMKNLRIAVFTFLLAAVCYGQNPNLGTSGAQFLNIPVGARSAALGNAVVGLNDDASSMFWNPAGLAKTQGNSAQFSHMRWFDMFDFSAAAAATYFEGIGTIGVSIIVFSMDKQEITTEEKPNGTGRFFDAQDVAIGLTFSRFLTDRFSIGITAKLIQQRIWNETATGVAFDVGTQYRLDFQNLVIAMKMSNFGDDLRFDGEDLNVTYDKNSSIPLNRLTPARLVTDDYPLPLNFQVGIAMDLFTSDFVLAKAEIDAIHPNDNKEHLLFGTELTFFDRVALRGGYKMDYADEAFTFGVGANLPIGDLKFTFDYSYSMFDILPGVNRITVGIEF
jgi:hypothetical protein